MINEHCMLCGGSGYVGVHKDTGKIVAMANFGNKDELTGVDMSDYRFKECPNCKRKY